MRSSQGRIEDVCKISHLESRKRRGYSPGNNIGVFNVDQPVNDVACCYGCDFFFIVPFFDFSYPTKSYWRQHHALGFPDLPQILAHSLSFFLSSLLSFGCSGLGRSFCGRSVHQVLKQCFGLARPAGTATNTGYLLLYDCGE